MTDMDAFLTSAGVLALVTLTFLEIVLGVDNVIFISILSSKLPKPLPPPRLTGPRLYAITTQALG